MTGIDRFKDYEEKLNEKYGSPGEMIFTISGLSGVGKSTLARFLGEELGLEVISAGKFFREEARKRDMDIVEFTEKSGDIEEGEGVDFDLMWERKALETAYRKDDILIEGRLSGVLLKDIAKVKILVTCDDDVIAERIAEREGISSENALERIKMRNEELIKKYKKKYNVDMRDEKYYNVVIDSSDSLSENKKKLLSKVKEKLEDLDV